MTLTRALLLPSQRTTKAEAWRRCVLCGERTAHGEFVKQPEGDVVHLRCIEAAAVLIPNPHQVVLSFRLRAAFLKARAGA